MKIWQVSVCLFFFTLTFISGRSWAQSFPVGEGSKYLLSLQEGLLSVHTSLYVASASENKLALEIFFEGVSPDGKKMWQQFILDRGLDQSISVSKGYFFVPEMQKPEILPAKNLLGAGDVLLSDFLLNQQKQIDALLVGTEEITVPAGKIKCQHYRKNYPKKVIDFWISSEVRPLGVVQLKQTSKSSDGGDNLEMKLVTILKNVKAKINPAEAVPLSAEGKKHLAQ